MRMQDLGNTKKSGQVNDSVRKPAVDPNGDRTEDDYKQNCPSH